MYFQIFPPEPHHTNRSDAKEPVPGTVKSSTELTLEQTEIKPLLRQDRLVTMQVITLENAKSFHEKAG